MYYIFERTDRGGIALEVHPSSREQRGPHFITDRTQPSAPRFVFLFFVFVFLICIYLWIDSCMCKCISRAIQISLPRKPMVSLTDINAMIWHHSRLSDTLDNVDNVDVDVNMDELRGAENQIQSWFEQRPIFWRVGPHHCGQDDQNRSLSRVHRTQVHRYTGTQAVTQVHRYTGTQVHRCHNGTHNKVHW